MITLKRFSPTDLSTHQLCFLHIPKTAGTTFTELLRSILFPDQLLIIRPEIINGLELADYDINEYDCICGHFTYEIHKLLNRTPLFLTFLREPISRAISNYYHIRNTNFQDSQFAEYPNKQAYLQVQKMTLENFIVHPAFNENLTNLQTRMLGLHVDYPVKTLADIPPFENSKRFVSINLAKERLEQFFFLGIQEEFSKSIDLFSYQFNLLPIDRIPELNIGLRQEEEIPPSTLDQLKELNNLDLELYEYGLKLLNSRYQVLVDELINICHEKELPIRECIEISFWQKKQELRDFSYHLESIHPRSGWYSVERVGERIWMWSGPETMSTIDLPLDREGNLQIRFFLRLNIDQEILESLELFCDNQPVLINKEPFGEGFVFTGILTAKPGTNPEPTRFSFRVCRTAYPPGMTAETPGARLLGVALSWIEISPLK